MALSSNEWAAEIAKRVGRRVAHYRAQMPGEKEKPGITAQALADRCTSLGMPMDRTVIAKLEKGTRQTITIGEVIVLSRALRVPPVALLFDLGGQGETEVLPGTSTDTWDALKWFTGETDRLPADDEVSQDIRSVRWYREHEQLVADWWTRRQELETTLATKGRTWLEAPEMNTAPEVAQQLIQLKADAMRATENSITLLRQQMRDAGLVPPSLGPAAAYLDSSPGQTGPGAMKGDHL